MNCCGQLFGNCFFLALHEMQLRTAKWHLFFKLQKRKHKKICGVAHLLVQSYVLEMTAFHHYENEFDFLGGVLFDWFDSSGGSGSHSKRQMSHD